MADDRGETLLELLIAVVIMGVAVVAVAGALVNSVQLSDVHRKQATAAAAVRDYGEAITNAVAGGGYVACAGPGSYATGFAVPSGYAKSVVSVRYWNGSAWQAGCTTDTGLQQLTIKVSSADDRAGEQLVVVVRKPCGLSDAPCA
jgi:prepilin-type N-terminal cleavage/methylation domain-containing protein